MLMDEGMDTGAMLLQERVAITPDDTAGTLSSKLADIGGRLLIDTLTRIQNGTVTPQPQDQSQATMAPLLKKEDGLLDWTLPALELVNRVRGLSPWPGAYTYLGEDRWVVWKASVLDRSVTTMLPGTIVDATKEGLAVATGDGVLRIMEFQPANSRRMSVAQYLTGHALAPGLRLGPPPPTAAA
jgi:methionyl-tRNA formyltransferase